MVKFTKEQVLCLIKEMFEYSKPIWDGYVPYSYKNLPWMEFKINGITYYVSDSIWSGDNKFYTYEEFEDYINNNWRDEDGK